MTEPLHTIPLCPRCSLSASLTNTSFKTSFKNADPIKLLTSLSFPFFLLLMQSSAWVYLLCECVWVRMYVCLCNKHEAQASGYNILRDVFLTPSPDRDRQLFLDSYSPKWPDRYELRYYAGISFPILHFTWGPRPPLLPTCGCQSTSAIRPQPSLGSAASAH